MSIWPWLALTGAVSLALAVLHPRLWVPVDVRAFHADGGKDSLHQTFHAQRGKIRGALMVVFALVGAGPLWGHWYAFVPAVLAYLCWHGAFWLYDFNPRLNRARRAAGEPWVGDYHVSWSPNASRLDRYVWRRAWLLVRQPGESSPPTAEDARVVAVAGPLYRHLLTQVLVLGGAAGLLLAGVAVVVQVVGY